MMADGHNEALRFHMAITAESIVGAGRRCHNGTYTERAPISGHVGQPPNDKPRSL